MAELIVRALKPIFWLPMYMSLLPGAPLPAIVRPCSAMLVISLSSDLPAMTRLSDCALKTACLVPVLTSISPFMPENFRLFASLANSTAARSNLPSTFLP